MDCSPPGSSVQRISQGTILKWVVISFSMGSSWPRNQTHISCTAGRFFSREDQGCWLTTSKSMIKTVIKPRFESHSKPFYYTMTSVVDWIMVPILSPVLLTFTHSFMMALWQVELSLNFGIGHVICFGQWLMDVTWVEAWNMIRHFFLSSYAPVTAMRRTYPGSCSPSNWVL